MGRAERPIVPSDGLVASFAQDLRRLRMQAGSPTYRSMARKAGYSASSLSAAASGQALPSLEVVLAYVGACHGDQEAWTARWRDVAARVREVAPDTGAVSALPGEVALVEPDNNRTTVVNSQAPDIKSNRAQVIEAFAAQLRDLRLCAGEPGLRALERVDPLLKKTTIGKVLNGETNPTLDFVLRFVRACVSLADGLGVPLRSEQQSIEDWRDGWMQLQRDLREHRRRR